MRHPQLISLVLNSKMTAKGLGIFIKSFENGHKVVVIVVYRTVNQLILRQHKLIILVPLLFIMLILVVIHLLDFSPCQVLCYNLFLQNGPSINANLFETLKQIEETLIIVSGGHMESPILQIPKRKGYERNA